MRKILASTLIGLITASSLNAGDCIMVKDLNVQFKNDSTIYSDSSESKEIQEFAQFLKKTNLYAVIEGHTSASAPAGYNYDLSTNRAKKVRNSLVNLGVNSKQVRYMGFGESSPLYNNSTEEGSAKNRRVIAEVFNSAEELASYIESEKARISSIKYKEQ